jgi:hypothetical protein
MKGFRVVTGITTASRNPSYDPNIKALSRPTCRCHNKDDDNDQFQLFRI